MRMLARLKGLLRPDAVTQAAIQAAAAGDVAVLAACLACGPGPDLGASQGRTPLMEAARFGREAAVAWLLDQGADVNRCDVLGITALMSAAREGHLGVMTLLRNRDADTERVNNFGYSALRWAVKWNQFQAASLLLAWNANCRETNPGGLTLADEALLWCNRALLALMLANGAVVTPQGAARAGLRAVLADDEQALRLVIAHGVRMDHPLTFGLTVPMAAVLARRPKLLGLLLEAGVNPLAKDQAGITALDLARAQGSHDLAAMLEARISQGIA
jgi:uncharacterized protein